MPGPADFGSLTLPAVLSSSFSLPSACCLVLFLVSLPFGLSGTRFLPGPADFGSLTLPAVLSSSFSLPFGLSGTCFLPGPADFGSLTLPAVLSSSFSLPFGLSPNSVCCLVLFLVSPFWSFLLVFPGPVFCRARQRLGPYLRLLSSSFWAKKRLRERPKEQKRKESKTRVKGSKICGARQKRGPGRTKGREDNRQKLGTQDLRGPAKKTRHRKTKGKEKKKDKTTDRVRGQKN